MALEKILKMLSGMYMAWAIKIGMVLILYRLITVIIKGIPYLSWQPWAGQLEGTHRAEPMLSLHFSCGVRSLCVNNGSLWDIALRFS